MRHTLFDIVGVLSGLAAGLLFWALVLGVHVQQHDPGLWSVRASRLVTACGLDYNGPPWTKQGVVLWFACGEDKGWRLWPPFQ